MILNAAQLALLGFFGLASVLLGQSTGKSSVRSPHGDPFTPVGSISVTPTVVQPGVQPNMVWGIEYPKAVEDLSEIDPGGGVTPKTTVDLKLRVMGVAWQYGNTLLPTALWVRVGAGSGWELVFFGSGADVNPEEVVFEKKGILPGTRIDFSARGQSPTGPWYSTRSTATPELTVLGMVNGDQVPDFAPAYEQGRIESFMTQFLDDSNSRVVLGPHEVIHTFELGSTNPGDWWFDMQDIVCVTTLSERLVVSGSSIKFEDPGTGSSTGVAASGGNSNTLDDKRLIQSGRKLAQ